MTMSPNYAAVRWPCTEERVHVGASRTGSATRIRELGTAFKSSRVFKARHTRTRRSSRECGVIGNVVLIMCTKSVEIIGVHQPSVVVVTTQDGRAHHLGLQHKLMRVTTTTPVATVAVHSAVPACSAAVDYVHVAESVATDHLSVWATSHGQVLLQSVPSGQFACCQCGTCYARFSDWAVHTKCQQSAHHFTLAVHSARGWSLVKRRLEPNPPKPKPVPKTNGLVKVNSGKLALSLRQLQINGGPLWCSGTRWKRGHHLECHHCRTRLPLPKSSNGARAGAKS